jgi:tetrahydromethanopterin S-methyltransferase subunit G
MTTLEELEKRIAKLERAELDVTTLKAIDRIGQSIGETISMRLAELFDKKIDAVNERIDQNHAEVMAQFEKLFEPKQEH